MPVKATKPRKPPTSPPVGSYWVVGDRDLFMVTYARPEDDILFLEDCRTGKIQQMKVWDWSRCAKRKLER